MKLENINVFKHSSRRLNDENNKMRENIIMSIINNNIPDDFYLDLEWKKTKQGIDDYLLKLIPKPYNSIICKTKAGRKYNYDFNIKVEYNDFTNEDLHIEFKHNASSINNLPQFVSPMNPSQYLSQSYENYYYEYYLPIITKTSGLDIPMKEEYMNQIHSNKPLCMKAYQELYYQGCSKSSKYTGNPEHVKFYELAKKISKTSIEKFIIETDLNIDLLSKYLYDSQKDKNYMLYLDNVFYLQKININDYMIEKVVKNEKMSRYDCYTKTGKKLKILLRWKNGNGIAFPAFQIS